MDSGFYFGYALALEGIDVRYKTYSYRWHYSYAVQMHHKYILVDDELVVTGSYNLSTNAEQGTFENTILFTADRYPDLVQAFSENFAAIWNTGRDGSLYEDLMESITEGEGDFPIVFESMALSWEEVTELKQAISENCPDIHTDDYKKHPERHHVCER